MRRIELLAPSGNADIAIEAIKHGADAVYIGPPSHGARKSASNSLDDIRRAVDFAHIYGAKVYVTVNTIIYEDEIRDVEKMIRELYEAGADALIVQDMGILRMDIPPIELHASTQCDIRTPEKARFLQDAGFSQLVLARELSLPEIENICKAVEIPVETFIHGALCVSYSGRCSAGYACSGRSGNRGECPQICRLPFTLKDATGKIHAKDKYLLSLKDFRAENHLEALIKAGVSSFKIEGRLKETGYVKNVTAYYSERLNEIITRLNGKSGTPLLRRSSYGTTDLKFKPILEKSFNRGFTDYRLPLTEEGHGSRLKNLASLNTPKSIGEKISDVNDLRAGDGISYFDKDGKFNGVLVNRISNGKIIGNRPFKLPQGAEIRRTSSVEWKKLMAAETSKRTLALDVTLDKTGVTATDETGAMVRLRHGLKGVKAKNPTDYRKIFEKIGNTPFRLAEFHNDEPDTFYPASALTSLKRELIEKLLEAKRTVYKFDYRRKETKESAYPETELDYRDNAANSLAKAFYREHRVKKIEPALETQGRDKARGRIVMTTRHCILRELGMCLKEGGSKLKMPLTMESGGIRLQPEFDCRNCEMNIRTLN